MATTGSNARGFVPAKRLDGQPPAIARLYPTGSNLISLFIGDSVYLNSNRKVQAFYAQQVSANSPAVLGVVVGTYDANKRPKTHAAGGALNISTSTAGFVAVCDDPDALFEIEVSASLGPSQIGHFCSPVSGSPVSAAGRSGMKLSDTTVVTAAGHAFQIVSLAPSELDGLGGPNNNVLVRISNHVWRRSTRLQGPLEAADA